MAALPIQDDEKILFEGDTMSMTVQYTTSSLDGAEYRVYAAKTGEVRSSACRGGFYHLYLEFTRRASLVAVTQGMLPCQKGAQRSGCVLSTACGLEQGGMVAQTDWEVRDKDTVVNVLVDELEQNQPYYFNVAVRKGGWTSSYVATQGTPTYLRGRQRHAARGLRTEL